MHQLGALRRAARAAGGPVLSLEAYKRHARTGDPSWRWFIRHYGSWVAALEAAGLQAGGVRRTVWTRAQLLDALSACHEHIRVPLTTTRYARWQAGHPDRPPLSSLRKAGFDQLAGEAGVPRTRSRDRTERFADDEILAAVRRASGERTPISAGEYNVWRDGQADRSSLPAAQTAIMRFGSWRAARAAAGATRSDTLSALRRALDEVPSLSSRGYKAWARAHPGAPSLDLQLREHGTWRQALARANGS